MRRRETLVLLPMALAGATYLSSCAKKKHSVARRPATTPATRTRPDSGSAIESTETGLASWYGHPYHGRIAASGEVYDMEQMTAAHRTLPFNTWVRVTSLTSGKSVDVRITDRGPFIDGRIIDLSHAAAQAIDLIGPGVFQVRLDVIAPPLVTPVLAAQRFGVQVWVFQDEKQAEHYREGMQARYGSARIVYRDAKPPSWRVLVGSEPSVEAATLLARRLQSEVGSGFVVLLDN